MKRFPGTLFWTALLLGIGLFRPPASASPEAPLAPRVPICELQGRGFSSPYATRQVRAQGVVSADLDTTSLRGFFLQDPACDDDPRSSDGVFVFLGVQENVVQAGDRVVVTGVVQENFGQTEINAASEGTTIISSGNPLPDPVDLNPPWENLAARLYFESREGMRVGVGAGVVVGPTNSAGETWLIREDLGALRVFQDDPRGTGVVVQLSGEGPYAVDPPAAVGDRLAGMVGPLRYAQGAYQIHLTGPPGRILGARLPRNPFSATLTTQEDLLTFSVGTFNLHNLFDTEDDPAREDPVRSAGDYQRHLEKLALTIQHELGAPLLLGVQEVENQRVLTDLLNRPELAVHYESLWVEGPDRRGIDVALLYQPARVRILSYAARQGCTSLVDET